MYSSPSTSQIFAPFACVTKNGAPSTLRNARTGELTPPGISDWAREKSSDEREVIFIRTSNAQCPTSNPQFLRVIPLLLTRYRVSLAMAFGLESAILY